MNGKKEDSLTIRIDFEGNALPARVKIGYISYPVSRFNAPPLRCYRCQRIGHIASGCTAKPRCSICGENHLKNDSDNHEFPKCANCKLNHVASSKDCRYNKQSSEITSLIKGGQTFAAAKKSTDIKYGQEKQELYLVNTAETDKDYNNN